jgi:uncharacterized protein (TIGR03790 family)
MGAKSLLVCAVCLAAVAALASPSAFALDLTGAGTLVLYNQNSPDGLAIADYYQTVHPNVQLLGLTGLSTDEQVTQDVYLNTLRPQVIAALNSSINCIVTTKGLPLTIVNPMPVGYSSSWSPYSSLESELARVDTINTAQLMANQNYLTSNRLASNPYYNRTGGFSFATYNTRLTSRLDGYTASDVEAAIDRAQHAVYNRPGNTFVIDNDPSAAYSRMPQLTAVLDAHAQPYTYDNTSTFVRTAPGPVLGYVSHGVHGGASADYLTNPTTGLAFSTAPGATFFTLESYNAYSFTSGIGSPQAQGQVAQWIARGGTAAVGNVQEPGASSSTVTNEDRMFQELLDGYTFAEAAWNATRQLSYVNTVVGDPLMTWKPWVTGDANQDGAVDLSDFQIVNAALGTKVGDANYNPLADMDGNGIIDASDIQIVTAAYQGVGADGLLIPIPEPGTLALLSLGLALLGRATRKSRKARP